MKKGYVKLAYPDIQIDSIVDGEGVRAVIWFQGCIHDCPGCHNPETHDIKKGVVRKIDTIKKKIEKLEYQSGVTFSGGDPMLQPYALMEMAKCVKENGMNVWCYTGYRYEELMEMAKKDKIYLDALKYIDVLVDGRFVMALKSFEAKFRGSSNQRIIDVQKSLKSGKVELVEKYI